MPAKAKKPCSYPRCPNLTTAKYCDVHQAKQLQEKKESNRLYDKYQRDERSARFYKSKEWKRVRQYVLKRDRYLCQHCYKQDRLVAAQMVHHIVEVKEDWNERLNTDNLVSLCHSCHNKAHGGA